MARNRRLPGTNVLIKSTNVLLPLASLRSKIRSVLEKVLKTKEGRTIGELRYRDLTVRVTYRNSRYSKLQFKGEQLHVTVPYGVDPLHILEKHRSWIEEKVRVIRSAERVISQILLVERSFEELRELVRTLTERFCRELDVAYNRISLREMTSKWGSCSTRGNLTFNTALASLPLDLVEFVVFHEVAHLVEPSHNRRFYEIMDRKFPNRAELEQRLFASWLLLERRGCDPTRN